MKRIRWFFIVVMLQSDILLYFREALDILNNHNGQADPETARPSRHHPGGRHSQAGHILEIRQGEIWRHLAEISSSDNIPGRAGSPLPS